MADKRQRLRDIIAAKSLLSGSFTLASGKASGYFFDMKKTKMIGLKDWVAALADWTSFLATHAFIPKDFDVRGWIDARPLEEARRQLGAAAA